MAHVINLSDFARADSAGIVARIRSALADFRAYRSIHDELDALTDRNLADLGISRLNVRDVARAAVYG
jgi:uncharacterized protein YjiS (DUF1127 family)